MTDVPTDGVCLCELIAVSEGVPRGVGGCRGEAGAEPAAPPAVPGDGRLVAAGGRQGGTVGPLVLARSLRSERRVSGARDWSAGESDHGAADSAHPHTSPQSDEAVLPPARPPGVLDQPEVLTSVDSNSLSRILVFIFVFGPFSISEYYSNIYIVKMHWFM